MNDSVARILVHLDDILDTRLGALYKTDPKVIKGLLESRYYAGRQMDVFPGVDMELYLSNYQNRGKEVLSATTMTGIMGLVADFSQRVMNKNLNAPISLDLEIHVNMYPFVLDEKEQAMIVQAVSAKLPLQPKVEMVNYTLEQLNPFFLGSNYNTVVMYHFHEWLEIHSKNENLKKYPCPNLTMFCPTLIKHKDDKIPVDLIDAFSKAMMMMQPFINAIYIPVDNFCTFMANKPNKPDGQKATELEKEISVDGDYPSESEDLKPDL